MLLRRFCLFFLIGLGIYITGCDNVAYEPKVSNTNPYSNKQILNVNKDIVPDSILEQYQKDAEILTARLIQADPKQSANIISLPTECIELFRNSLIQVYNAKNIPARDVVIDEYKISVFPLPVTNLFYVKVDTSKLWVKKWLSGNLYTGVVEIDTLIQNYKLSINSKIILPSATYFDLKSEEPLNLIGLCYLFNNIDGIYEAFPESSIGDGNNITAEIFDNYILLDYSYGFGDCPAGCIGRHNWKFRVYYNGVVQFDGESGTPI